MSNKIDLKLIKKEIIKINKKNNSLKIKNDTLINSLIIDSLDYYSLIMTFEKMSKKKVSDKQLDKFSKISDLIYFFS